MTHFNRNTLSRGTFATLLLAVAPFTFAGQQAVPAAAEIHSMGHIVVTAPRPNPAIRSIADLGTMTVTANRDVVLADLGSMTVTVQRDVTLADLGTMTVTAARDVTLADLGAMTVTAPRAVTLADLGTMTVTAPRTVTLANLGSMTVTASREVVLAHNQVSRAAPAF